MDRNLAAMALPPTVSIVVPTFKERDNVPVLFERLKAVMPFDEWEMIVVDDDSPDGTAREVRAMARQDPRIRCLHRIRRRGLSTAVIEGIMSSSAPYVVVMDADLQHDEAVLPQMIAHLANEDVDLVVGSRYVDGGGVGEWNHARAAMSRFATRLSRLVVPERLSDPMSGFFAVKREVFEQSVHRLSGLGYKILMDLFASAPAELSFREVAYEFRTRQHGESKLDSMVLWEYLMLLLDKATGGRIPPRFVLFSLVGGTGVVVHFAILSLLLKGAGSPFDVAQGVATLVAMTSNFFVNNVFTYRDKRLKGGALVKGLLSFYAACAIGAVANVGVAGFLFEQSYTWWLAGGAGILVGVVWNYVATSLFTWKAKPA